MKRFLPGLIVMIMLPFFSFSQILDPVKWSFKVEQTKPGEATLVLTARADKGWHVYSQDIPPDGPLPTTFTFKKSNDFERIGKVTESKPIMEDDPMFKMVLKYFADKAVFKQQVKILSKKDFVIKGTVNFMCCDDKQCLPPTDVYFEFRLKGDPNAAEAAAATAEPAKPADTAKKAVAATAKTDSANLKASQAKLSETAADKAASQSLLWFFLISFLADRKSTRLNSSH